MMKGHLHLLVALVTVIHTCSAYLQFLTQSSKVTVSDTSKINAIGTGSFSISLFFQSEKEHSYSAARALLSTRERIAYEAFMVAFHGNWDIYTGYRPFIQLRYNYVSYSTSDTYTDGNWQHLVITRHSNTKSDKCELNYYMNATNIYSTEWDRSGGCVTSIVSNGSLFFGYDVGTWGWIGNLAHISFWNRAINLKEIQQIYNNVQLNESFISFTNLLHYYPLNEDASDCENNGIIYDVWNHHNGHLGSSTDPKCVNNNNEIVSDPVNINKSTSKDAGIIVVVVVGLIILFLSIATCIYYKYSKHRKLNVNEQGNSNEMKQYAESNINPTAPTNDEPPPYSEVNEENNINTTKGVEFEYKNIAASAPMDEDKIEPGKQTNHTNNNMEGEFENEGTTVEQYSDIKQWFNEDIDLNELNENDKEIYMNTLIENGFDKLSIIKKINDSDLIEIGINKLGHRKLIVSAISKL